MRGLSALAGCGLKTIPSLAVDFPAARPSVKSRYAATSCHCCRATWGHELETAIWLRIFPDGRMVDQSAQSIEQAAAEVRRPPFLILVVVSAIGPLALNIFMPSMPGLQATFGVSYGTVQLTLTLFLIGLAVCQLFYGPLSDRYGRRPLLLAGLILFVLASIACAFAVSIEMLIAARLIQAIGGASGIVLSRAIVRDL
jgi:Na+/melibiose symporter-like transporter